MTDKKEIIQNDVIFDYTFFDDKLQDLMRRNFCYDLLSNNIRPPFCNTVCNYLSNYHKTGGKISQQTFDVFMKYISTNNCVCTGDCCHVNNNCIAKCRTELICTMTELLKYCIISLDNFNFLLKYPAFDQCYTNIINNDEYIKIIVRRKFKYSCFLKYENIVLIDYVFQKCSMNSNSISILCKSRSYDVTKNLVTVIENFEGQLSNDCMNNACKSLPYTKQIISALEKKGLQIKSEHLAIVCKYCNIESIEYILQQTRLPIDHNHFVAVLNAELPSAELPSYDFIKKVARWVPKYEMEKMELLIKYGFVPTRNDIIYAIKLSKEIPNIDRFGIICDKEILELCWHYDFYPNYNFVDVTSEMISLQKLCLTEKKAEISKLIKEKKIFPDDKCMENACKFKNNITTYKALENFGGVTTFNCVKNCAKEFRNNNFLIYLMNSFENIYKGEIDGYKDKINNLENKVIDLEKQLKTNNEK